MTTPAKTAAYTQCEQCGFWHAPAEPHCANCGVSFVKEYETRYDDRLGRAKEYGDKGGSVGTVVGVVGSFGGIIGGFIIGGGIIGGIIGDRAIGGIVVFGVVVGIFAVGIGGPFVGGIIGKRIGTIIGRKKAARRVLKPPKVVTSGLRQNEEQINKRLKEIGQKEQKIKTLRQELSQQGDPQRNRVRFKALDKGAAELSRQRDRYTGKLREIELIRWSNQLSPLLSYSPQLTEQQATNRLYTLSNIQTQGQKLAQIWKQTPLADEETRCAEHLNQALTTCDQLRQDLLDLKTALAVGDISAFSKEEQRASQTALELLDTFNALPDVGGFTAGFKKLEDEYLRLQSEDEVRQLTK